MKRAWLVCTVVVCLPAFTHAQPPPQDRGEFRGDREGPAAFEQPDPDEVARILPEQLELTDTQREQYAAIVAKYEGKWAGLGEQRDKVRDLQAQYAQARESGDQQRATEIREQIRDIRRGQGQVLREFLGEVQAILDPEQVTRLDNFRRTMQRRPGTGPGFRGGMREMFERLPDELGLDADQYAQYQELLKQQRTRMEEQRERWCEIRPLIDEM